MTPIIPSQFFFRYQLPVRYIERLPKRGRRLLDLPADCALPDSGELGTVVPQMGDSAGGKKMPNGDSTKTTRHFGEIRVAWNTRGLGLSVRVRGKTTPCIHDADTPTESDAAHFWFDTRNTKSIHRASRFCHYYCLLPNGLGVDSEAPLVLQVPIAQAREQSPPVSVDVVRLSGESLQDGYRLDAWFPAESLHGFHPADDEYADQNSLIGFYYCLRDHELGEQFLSVGWEFPFAHDPSLWATLELVR